jgi:hypothetical protein
LSLVWAARARVPDPLVATLARTAARGELPGVVVEVDGVGLPVWGDPRSGVRPLSSSVRDRIDSAEDS